MTGVMVTGLQPTLGFGNSRGLDASACRELRHRLREMIAHGALRKPQQRGNLTAARSTLRKLEDLAFAVRERVAVHERLCCETRIHDVFAGMDAANGRGQLA